MNHRIRWSTLFATLVMTISVRADGLPVVEVEGQPLAAQAQRLLEALDYLGAPLPGEVSEKLQSAISTNNAQGIQEVLDQRCLAGVHIKSEKEMETLIGPANAELIEQGWRIFLVKVINEAEVERAEIRAESPNAESIHRRGSHAAPTVTSLGLVGERFLQLEMFNNRPMTRLLSGLGVEYKIIQAYSRDAGRREGRIGFGLYRRGINLGSDQGGARRLAGSKKLPFLFTVAPAVVVKLSVTDFDGKPCMGSFVFKDSQGRVYPAMGRRLAPDFFFHQQIYRETGETVLLPPGEYEVTYTRGPEYLVLNRKITVPDEATHSESFQLKRWVHPARKGWFSGDHHVHAAGCQHYESPTEGVTPADMMRHILGEDLNVGCVLSWGPCWYHQKRYFEGKEHSLSQPNYIMRYDVEVSGFPSSHCGHLCLLRLEKQDYEYPDGRVAKVIEDWPSWDLPVLKWAKAQGGVVGFAHSGSGLQPVDQAHWNTKELPNYYPPAMNGIGANEYLIDVAHDACDFISTVDTQPVWELNTWYHTLNSGYRCRISGETDFPCIYGERVGLGRVYVHLDGKLKFDDWAEGIKQGRSYVSDGLSHLMEFSVNDHGVGIDKSEMRLEKSGTVKVKALVAAYLQPEPTEETEIIRNAALSRNMNRGKRAPYWHVERARIGESRKVPVEVVVNGHAVARKEIVADGTERIVEFDVPIEYSSWICLRIFPTSHTNPVFVMVDEKPIRTSRKSVEWCLDAIDRCWKEKSPHIREEERQAARDAYDFAIAEYKKRLRECVAD